MLKKVAAAAAALALAAGVAWAQQETVVLAVMPFRSVGESAALNLGESFSETLTTKLVGLRGLKVYERSQFQKVAGELQVQRDSAELFDRAGLARAGAVVSMDYLVVGSVTLAAGKLACQIRVVRVKDGQAVLARQLDGPYPDHIFEMQDSLALQVANSLRLSLDELDKRRLSKRPSSSFASWELYNQSLGRAALEERILLLEKALEGDPSFTQAAHLLADLRLEQGDAEKARSVYASILATDPADYRALYNSALLAYDAGDMAAARSRMGECLAHKGGDPDVLYHLGLFSEFGPSGSRLGADADVSGAREHYRRALAADPLHRDSLLGAGMLDVVMSQETEDPAVQLSLLTSARDQLGRFLELCPDALEAPEVENALLQIDGIVPQLRDYLKGRN